MLDDELEGVLDQRNCSQQLRSERQRDSRCGAGEARVAALTWRATPGSMANDMAQEVDALLRKPESTAASASAGASFEEPLGVLCLEMERGHGPLPQSCYRSLSRAVQHSQLSCSLAAGLKSKELFGKQDPYCVVTFGGDTQKTATHHNGHTQPVWKEELRFTVCAASRVPNCCSVSRSCTKQPNSGVFAMDV